MLKILIFCFIVFFQIACHSKKEQQKSKKELRTTVQVKEITLNPIDSLIEKNQRQVDSLIQSLVTIHQKRDILDYYLMLPENYFVGCPNYADYPEGRVIAGRKAFITHQNTPNGYLTATIRDNIELKLALFVYEDKPYVFWTRSFPGHQCYESNLFYFSEHGKWIGKNLLIPQAPETHTYQQKLDSIRQLSPIQAVFPYYKLPEYGTSVEIRDLKTDILLYTLLWDKGKFILTE